MKQEEKDLLLKDLCARLPYGVKGLINGCKCTIYPHDIEDFEKDLRTITPFLRPLSSMTEEERQNYGLLLTDAHYNTRPSTTLSLIDWLNEHHFDYRGLIDKGLAIEVKGDDYDKACKMWNGVIEKNQQN